MLQNWYAADMNEKEDIRRLSAAFSTLALTIAEIVNDRIRAVQEYEQKKLALLQERQMKLQPVVQTQPVPQQHLQPLAPVQPVLQQQIGAPYVDKKAVADHLGVTVRCIDNWMKRGLVPYYKIGRQVRFRLKEVEESLDARCKVNGRRQFSRW